MYSMLIFLQKLISDTAFLVRRKHLFIFYYHGLMFSYFLSHFIVQIKPNEDDGIALATSRRDRLTSDL